MKSAEPVTGSLHRRLQGHSIASTLTFLHAVSSAFILFLICLIAYVGTTRDLQNRNADYIADETNVLLALLQEPNGKVNLEREIIREQSSRMHVVHYVRILDDKGHTIVENPQMDKLLPPSFFPEATRNDAELRRSVKHDASDGNVYRLYSIRTTMGGFGGAADVAQIAFDITSIEDFYDDFRAKLAVLLLFGVLLSVTAGYLAAQRGLTPLDRITGATKEMTANRLDERIRPGQWPRELAELALHFNGMLDRLQESFDGLRHYTGNLAHELRTPINNLMIEGDIALLRERTPEEYQKVIGSSMEEYERLSRLIDSLLFLARCDSSAQKIKQEKIDVPHELQRMAEFYSALCMDQDVEISSQGSAVLWADAVLFRRALSNLVSNALKHTPAGGKIALSAIQRHDLTLEVSVSDTGSGIDPEQLPHIFDRFYRAVDSEEAGIQGHGLGLSIVKAIMNMHRGRVEARSMPGQGTTVSLVFPSSAVV